MRVIPDFALEAEDAATSFEEVVCIRRGATFHHGETIPNAAILSTLAQGLHVEITKSEV